MPASRPRSSSSNPPLAPGREGASTGDRRKAREDAGGRVQRLAASPPNQQAIGLLQAGRLAEAERAARGQIARSPRDVVALCMLADLANRAGFLAESERLLRSALSVEPLFVEAQLNLARILSKRDGLADAIGLIEDVSRDFPERTDLTLTRLGWLGQAGNYELAAKGYRNLLDAHPGLSSGWTAYGHLLGTLGHLQVAVEAYRRALEIDVRLGDAWWGLANLKTDVFEPAEVDTLRSMVGDRTIEPGQLALLHFSLAKALQDRADYEHSFRHYEAGNRIRRSTIRFDPAEISAEIDRSIAFFTADRLRKLAGAGDPSPGPIFIVGMPRSGSTLIEQILASHPAIEGTSELPYIPMLVHRLLEECWSERQLLFPNMLEGLAAERIAAAGRAYLEAAATHRRLSKPLFIDKLPNNWRYIGFILTILPNARIIDARRDPMACLWSNYRQWFAQGQEYSYDFRELVRQYRDYRRLTAHFDAQVPGRIIRVEHEALLADPERAICWLLDQLDLPFAEECLRFYENRRPVRTASAQQVRRPIGKRSADDWAHFRPWLARLEDLLATSSG